MLDVFLLDFNHGIGIAIHRILIDNGKNLQQLFSLQKRLNHRKQEFDSLYTELDIEHELSSLIHPKRNSLIDQFNVLMGKMLYKAIISMLLKIQDHFA